MATLTYADQATLKNSVSFRDRVSIAISKYVQYVLNNPAATVSQSNWARNVLQSSPDSVALQVVFLAIWDSNITGMTSPVDQTVLSDATLQSTVEAAINTSIIPKFGF